MGTFSRSTLFKLVNAAGATQGDSRSRGFAQSTTRGEQRLMTRSPLRISIGALFAATAFFFPSIIQAQIPGGTSAREIPTEVQKTDPRVDQVIERDLAADRERDTREELGLLNLVGRDLRLAFEVTIADQLEQEIFVQRLGRSLVAGQADLLPLGQLAARLDRIVHLFFLGGDFAVQRADLRGLSFERTKKRTLHQQKHSVAARDAQNDEQ